MMEMTWFLAGLLTMLLLLALKQRLVGFRTQTPGDLADRGPDFDLRRHLSGPILCEGVIFGPSGRVTSRFVADMVGEWEGNQGRLIERFRYDRGGPQDRCWHLRLGNDGQISATAPDVEGEGRGIAVGPAVQLRYRLRLRPDAGGHVLDVTDWMYLMENGTILNRSQFTKCGVTVAELVATMRKVTA